MGDFGLYFYGLIAHFVLWCGAILAMFGIFALLLGSGAGAWGCLIIGLIICFLSKAMRFKFKRQSGHIIYSGGEF